MNIEKYCKLHDELMKRLERGKITTEQAKEINTLAFNKYITESFFSKLKENKNKKRELLELKQKMAKNIFDDLKKKLPQYIDEILDELNKKSKTTLKYKKHQESQSELGHQTFFSSVDITVPDNIEDDDWLTLKQKCCDNIIKKYEDDFKFIDIDGHYDQIDLSIDEFSIVNKITDDDVSKDLIKK